MTDNTLYTYWRSSAAYRVRIALHLKGIAHRNEYIHLVKDGGQQRLDRYRSINPQQLVPAWRDDNGVLTQSLAIVEYLDECYPEPPLLPRQSYDRARVRALALAVATDIHPINNLRVLKYLRHELGAQDEQINAWYRHWVEIGLDALEQSVGDRGYCFGNSVTLADLCLVPQLYNARRFEVSLDLYPRLLAIESNCLALDAFRLAAPAAQPDAQS
ncbi:maleylacetoacetate isomerase [Marinobacterium zhoushanense]|uniref:Maleylacetoacetate isomerase n=1 Tax=Marinobacterium zhoushanense TaxID=1679163 RepID=A0ABQ1K9I6_9GAMM|nr:maleylacetoacetate isomerase [Marinobacterium zhoushanense]GGB91905.1 maleylacetoacetate isomerase [Marinobacterium zhoushanense]